MVRTTLGLGHQQAAGHINRFFALVSCKFAGHQVIQVGISYSYFNTLPPQGNFFWEVRAVRTGTQGGG